DCRVNLRTDSTVAENRFNFGSKQQRVPWNLRIKKRSYSQPIPCQKQPPPLRVPNRDGKLPVHLLQAAGSILFIKMQDHFRIRRRAKNMSARLQVRPQFDVIENLAVENNPERFVLVLY